MAASSDAQPGDEIQQSLREHFDAAAAKSMAVINQDDAEPEMVRFLNAVKAHPEQHAFVVRLFVESFSESSYLKWEPWEFMQFCMYDLRWHEIRNFINEKRDEDVKKRGARSSTVWNDILASFDDNWEGAKHFQRFNDGKALGSG